jgi:alkanesulfonate monooxygenase SsuD/methylene tetrahydromethanopterin reductase-like flavin-dependent oxidoreductase (luciferase family)
MFPGRLWIALGSGEAANEHITGDPWPDKATRNARLLECVEIMRALFAGETVSHDGLVRVDRAKLFTLPAEPPPLIGPAVSVETAAMAGGWADGLPRSTSRARSSSDDLRLPRERRRGQAARAPGAPLLGADRGGGAARRPRPVAHERLSAATCWDLETIEEFDAKSESVTPEDVRDVVLISSDLGQHRAWLEELAALGFDELNLHHVGQDLEPFIDAFGEHVLPGLAS